MPDRLDPAEGLAGDGDAEHRADHRVDQADQRDRAGGHRAETGEPAPVGDAGAGDHQPQVATDGRSVEVRRRPLDEQGDGQQHQAAGDQLPRDEGEHVDRRGPALDQHEPERRDHDRAEGRDQPERVELAGRAEHQQRRHRRCRRPAATIRAMPARSPMTSAASAITASGDVACRVEASPPGSRYAARNSSGKNIPMLHTPSSSARHHHSPRREATRGRQQHQTGRQRPQRRREQGPVGRQQALGDQVRRTPGGGCEGREEERAPGVSFHGNYYTFRGRYSEDMEPDHVDGILAQWARERPDLDASPIGLIGRLHRLADVLNVELRKVFAEAGLGDGDFDVLVTLRRHGAPYELTPGELGASTMVTSSAVTKRIDRLERAGLVTRTVSEDGRALTPDPAHRRGLRPGRPADGPRHIANEQRLVAGLSERDRAQLAAILRRWGQSLDDDLT